MRILPFSAGKLDVVLLAAVLAAISGCEFNCSVGGVDKDKVAKEVGEKLGKEVGSEVQVTCPELEKEGPTRCSAKAATGEGFIVEVVKKDDGVSWETKGVAIGKKVEKRIIDVYGKESALEFEKVECPPLLLAQDAAKVTCKGHKKGVEVAFEITFANGTIKDAIPRSGVVLGRGAAKLAQDTLAKQGITAKIDCGPPYRVAVPGDTFTCTATDQAGKSLTLYYRINSAEGHVSMQTEPF